MFLVSSKAMGLGIGLRRGILFNKNKIFNSSALVSITKNRTYASSPKGAPISIDRDLPDPFAFKKQNYYYFTCYGVGITLACLFIFNYEKTTSPVITSTLYSLRRSQLASSALGEQIDFANQWPWVWGTLNTVKGEVDIKFDIKGTKNTATLYLIANRESKQEQFKVRKFLLQFTDGPDIDLLKDESIQLM